jgi:Tol biopolymer transport system component
MALNIAMLFFLSFLASCGDENEKKGCPGFDFVPSAPYSEPAWHPDGQVIGFNHRPLKEIIYTYGYECPHQARYVYENDSIGFWLINKDGSNMRRALPFYLYSAAWSPDGKWVAFMKDAQIFKMPFDGEKFDTTAVVQLTVEGSNFFPSWSPDGEWIAFDSNVDSPNGMHFIWKMRSDGTDKTVLASTPEKGETRTPYWGDNFRIVHLRYVSGIAETEIYSMDSDGNDVIRVTNDLDRDFDPKFSSDAQTIFYKSQSSTTGAVAIWKIDLDNPKRTMLKVGLDFSVSPDNDIVYLDFDYSRIDKDLGTLWIMDATGIIKHQLTHNIFKISTQ